jgi:hypothetical protein
MEVRPVMQAGGDAGRREGNAVVDIVICFHCRL